MKVKIVTFEGTPEEYKAVANHLNTDLSEGSKEIQSENGRDTRVKDAYRVMLTRLAIPKGQLDLYKVLGDGEVEYSEYLERMGRDDRQIAGLHGALGNRINQTEEMRILGLTGIGAVMIWRQDGDNGYWSLKPEFIEVLKEEGII